MLYLISSFAILTLSISGLCVLGAKVVMATVEQGRLWGSRSKLRKLTPVKICIFVSTGHVIDLMIYAAETAPSILLGQPAYGQTFHAVLGWCSKVCFYGNVFQLFVLCTLKTKVIFDKQLKHQKIIVQGFLGTAWFMSFVLAIVVQRKLCPYWFSLKDPYVYKCDVIGTENLFRLITLNCVTCGTLLVMGAGFASVSYCQAESAVRPLGSNVTAGTDDVVTFTQARSQHETATFTLAETVHVWCRCLAGQLTLCSFRILTVVSTLIVEPSPWLGLACTVLHIGYCTASVVLYLRTTCHVLNYAYTVEKRQKMHNSLVHFRAWSSQRSLRNSFRESCRSLHNTQVRASLAQQAAKLSTKFVAANGAVKVELPKECFLAQLPDRENRLPDVDDPVRHFNIPVVHVEVISKEETCSLCNYRFDSDDSIQSLQERSAKSIMSASTSHSSIPRTTSSSTPNSSPEMLIRADALYHHENFQNETFRLQPIFLNPKHTSGTRHS